MKIEKHPKKHRHVRVFHPICTCTFLNSLHVFACCPSQVGYEFLFPIHSPLITRIQVLKRGFIGRNKNACAGIRLVPPDLIRCVTYFTLHIICKFALKKCFNLWLPEHFWWLPGTSCVQWWARETSSLLTRSAENANSPKLKTGKWTKQKRQYDLCWYKKRTSIHFRITIDMWIFSCDANMYNIYIHIIHNMICIIYTIYSYISYIFIYWNHMFSRISNWNSAWIQERTEMDKTSLGTSRRGESCHFLS